MPLELSALSNADQKSLTRPMYIDLLMDSIMVRLLSRSQVKELGDKAKAIMDSDSDGTVDDDLLQADWIMRCVTDATNAVMSEDQYKQFAEAMPHAVQQQIFKACIDAQHGSESGES